VLLGLGWLQLKHAGSSSQLLACRGLTPDTPVLHIQSLSSAIPRSALLLSRGAGQRPEGCRHQIESPKRPTRNSTQGRLPHRQQ
jgi:hypothetical protein